MPGGAAIRLSYDPFGRLVLTLPNRESHVGVWPVRAFPFSAPAQWISFCDEQGHEVYSLPELSELPEETRLLLEADLARREFVPVIQRIDSVSPGAEPTEWNVVTDRGETCFTLNNEDHIRRMGLNAALITDSNGVRYLIDDLEALDAASRRILRRYL
jgi:hypothetical protein